MGRGETDLRGTGVRSSDGIEPGSEPGIDGDGGG